MFKRVHLIVMDSVGIGEAPMRLNLTMWDRIP